MKVKELTRIWVRQEEARIRRTREIAKMLNAEIGDREVSVEQLVARGMEYYGSMPPKRVVNLLATAETIAIYDLIRGL